jgi:hypothetical protein
MTVREKQAVSSLRAILRLCQYLNTASYGKMIKSWKWFEEIGSGVIKVLSLNFPEETEESDETHQSR